ncbi:MAG: alpha-galactosidase [Phycisphaerales bacterium]|nr:alpha-galactosidase [Phycisphaerales bacterium]
MPNVCFLGAGSFFTTHLATDVMQVERIGGGEFRLVDIDAARLELCHGVVREIARRVGGDRWQVTATTDRRQALAGADYVINCIEVAGIDTVRLDNDIPLKYGISQCIGDTIGPGGLMKALRTGPVWLDVLQDCEELCSNAWVLNYTNPMSILCLLAQRFTTLPVVGLCHSVQGSSRQLAEYADVSYAELDWACAGINHLSWFTRLRHRGSDLYPTLLQRIAERPEIYEKDPVRFDMLRHFGAFVTESSGHFSEYAPYYRKRPELIREYCREKYLGQESFYADHWPQWRQDSDDFRRRVLAGTQELKLERSPEYASYIIEARETNAPTVIHGNVANDGLIDNLPQSGCVEVACLVDRTGIHPTHFGPLPPQLAALCASNMAMFELAALAILEQSREAAVHALLLDPLSAAVCSPAEIRALADELFAAQAHYLPDLR